jgi:hypothetical protein
MLKPTDPTDPEVPAAKRLREARRKRSLVLGASAIVVLVVGLIILLFRIEQQMTARPATATPEEPQTGGPQPASPSMTQLPLAAEQPSAVAGAQRAERAGPTASTNGPVQPPLVAAPSRPSASAPGAGMGSAPAAVPDRKSPGSSEIFRHPSF